MIEWYEGELIEREEESYDKDVIASRNSVAILSFLISFVPYLTFSYFFFIFYEAIVYFCTHQNPICYLLFIAYFLFLVSHENLNVSTYFTTMILLGNFPDKCP